MSAGEKYVAAVYVVVFVALLGWLAIIATKLARLSREVAELAELVRGRVERGPEREPEPRRDEVGV